MEIITTDNVTYVNSEQSIEYRDAVKNFDLIYKNTPPSQKPNTLIHYHECFEIALYISADLEVYLDDLHYNCTAHDLLIIPPRKIHKFVYKDSNKNYVRYVFYFTREHIEKAFGPNFKKGALYFFESSACHKISLPPKEYLHLHRVFQNMYEHVQNPTSKNRDLLSLYASTILQEIYQVSDNRAVIAPVSEEPSTVEQILRYINEHYSQNITLELLEKEFYLNQSYICRIFKKTMGISLINYLQYKRVLEAQELLVNSNLPIIHISMECGFNSVQHFYRVFKKITRLSPNEYKKQQLSTALGQTFTLQRNNTFET